MDISFNPRANALPNAAALSAATAAGNARAAERPALVVSDARAGAVDAAEAVPESALRRDDGLGRLFAAAFNLPAPPMPAFPE